MIFVTVKTDVASENLNQLLFLEERLQVRDLPERSEHENADLNQTEPQHTGVSALASVAESGLARLEVALFTRHVLGSVVQLAYLQLDGCIVIQQISIRGTQRYI
jgi:hypothetical protein